MNLIENTIKLRGFLAEEAKVPPSDGITEDAFSVLFLALMSGTWDIATNKWAPRTTVYRVVCPGPWFCGFTRGMKRGDYVEVEGDTAKRYVSEIRAIQVRKLDRPLLVIDTGEDG